MNIQQVLNVGVLFMALAVVLSACAWRVWEKSDSGEEADKAYALSGLSLGCLASGLIMGCVALVSL